MNWWGHVLGLDNASGHWYLFWSGVAGDLSYLAVLSLVWRKLRCHSDRCHRIGIHRIEGTQYTVCARHHPDYKPHWKPAAVPKKRTEGPQ